jgi:hypothetical protein
VAEEIVLKDKEDEGTNFILWIIFLCLLGSGVILISQKQRVGFALFVSSFIFWVSVRFISKRRNKTIKA